MITISEVREALGWSPDRDVEVKALRDAVVALWEERTGLLWSSRTGYVQTIRTPTETTKTLLLELQPVTAVTQVRVRFILADDAGEWETLESGDYTLIGRRRLVRTRAGFDPFRPSYQGWEPLVEVTYSGGAAEVAANIRSALTIQARFMAERMSTDKVALSGVSNPMGGSTTYLGADLHPFFASAVKSNRRVA